MDFYTEKDVDPSELDGRRVAVVGYGNLGRSIALNLRDNDSDVVVGNLDDEFRAEARAAGFEVLGIADAVALADVVFVLVPDEVLGGCFEDEIAPALRPGSAVVFGSGYCLAYGLVVAPPEVDVLLIAPRMVGANVRNAFLSGDGFVTYVSVEQDTSGHAKARLLALAHASGCLLRGAFVLSARDEAMLDLYVEQSFGPVMGIALQAAFAAGVGAGLDPEALVLEMYMSGEMQATFGAFAEHGFYGSVLSHGFTAAYGGYLRTLDIDMGAMTERFAGIADDIRSGGFARSLQAEQEAGSPTRDVIAAVVSGDDPMSHAEARARRALGS
ncbi:MAG: NAD(P)-binding domain-containing protein [Acidimicrobiia bacterium]